MAEGGEFIFSVAATDAIGPKNLEAMHQQARRGYAEGGFVSAGDVPKPPDYHAYGNMVGYSADAVDKKAYDLAVAYVNAQSKKGHATGGGGYGFQALIDYLDGRVLRGHQEYVPMPYAKNLERAAKPDSGKAIAAIKKVMYLD